MPTTLWWVGIGAGGVIAALHAGVRALLHRWARHAGEGRPALQVEMLSMIVRGALVITLAGLVLLLSPIPTIPFTVSLLGFLLLSIAVDLLRTIRRLRDTPHQA